MYNVKNEPPDPIYLDVFPHDLKNYQDHEPVLIYIGFHTGYIVGCQNSGGSLVRANMFVFDWIRRSPVGYITH